MKLNPEIQAIHVHGNPDGSFLVESNHRPVKIIQHSPRMLDDLYETLLRLTGDQDAATRMIQDVFDMVVGRGHRDRN